MAETQRLAREYELVYILRPTVSPSEARKVADRITEVVEKRGAKLTRVDNWGKRKLAYQIRKHTRGIFVYVKLIGFTDVVAELERNLRNFDDVMRFMTVRLEDVLDTSGLEVDPEEVVFREIEVAGEEEDDDPTFEESLGMVTRARRVDVEAADLGDREDGDGSTGLDDAGSDEEDDA
jgi:small subunit ribosomal protein S6